MFPAKLGVTNSVSAPFAVPAITRGWAAGDAAYARGAFDLGDGQALVLRGRSPECRFWNLCLWNQYLCTYDYGASVPVSINGHQVSYEPDGTWTVVVSPTDPGHPNWVSTAGHRNGILWFRWFYPAEVPPPISAEVVSISSLASP